MATTTPKNTPGPERAPCAIIVRERARTLRAIRCEYDGRPAFMLRLLRACYRTRAEALALVRAGDMVSIDFCLEFCEPRGTDGRAIGCRAADVLAAARGAEAAYVFDDAARRWHAWAADGRRVAEDPGAPALGALLRRLRALAGPA